jgi:probable LLM family oxidoreductase
MELGINTFGDSIFDPQTGRTISHGERLRNLVEEIEMADKVGLDIFTVGEHHRADYAVTSPDVVLAAGAARTENIRLSSGVTVLSSDDPVRVYERFATLDGISNGRAEIMAGRGSFIESFPLFGYDLNDYNQLFDEKLDLLLKLQQGGRISWEGDMRAPLKDVEIFPEPVQDAIPIWIASGGTPQSAARAAQLGLPLVLAIIGGSPYQFQRIVDFYRQTGMQAGHSPEQLRVATNSHGFVWDTDEEAKDMFFPAISQAMTNIGRERGWGAYSRENYERMIEPDGALYIGSPETVAAKIIDLQKRMGITRFTLQTPVGTMPHEQVLRTIELFGTKVAPIVRDAVKDMD